MAQAPVLHHDPPDTLVRILRRRAATQPDASAFIFLENGEVEAGRLTYAALDRRARAIAARLRSIAAPGDRALIALPQGLAFVEAFYGCLYAGVIAIPTKAPAHNRRNVRLDTIVGDAGATIAFGEASLVQRVATQPESCPGLETLTWLTPEDILDGAGDVSAEAVANVDLSTEALAEVDSIAFFQYTSGSTSSPKGVVVTHRNLAHNALDLSRAWPASAGDVMVSWVPAFHDLGLVFGVVYPVFNGIPCYLMAPASFLAKPLRWLEAMSRYGATHTSGPNFAFDLCVDRVAPEQRASLDLRRWAVTINGGEPVRESTVRRFHEAFGPCGFAPAAMHPSFGLAECTLRVTSPSRQEAPFLLRLDAAALARNRIVPEGEADACTQVALGSPGPETTIRIVDPETSAACAPDEVGEIWVAGPSVASGYWRKPEESARTFDAHVAGTGEGPFLRTGDLGFLRDGRLYVTGRIKDVLIVHGLNHYPQDVEATVDEAHPALRKHWGAAFTIVAGGEERLVIAQELERTALRTLDSSEVISAMRQAVAEQHDLQVHAVALLRPGAIPKTTSGKIQRQATKRAFVDGSLEVVAEWRATLSSDRVAEADRSSGSAPLRDRVRAAVARCLSVPAGEIDPRQPLARYGMESVSAVALSTALGEIAGRPLDATVAYDHPTVDALVRHLEAPRMWGPASAGAGTWGPAFAGAGTWGPALAGPVSVRAVGASADREPIAIVGVGCRFPGAENPDALWRLLKDGVDAVREVPPGRWNASAVFSPEAGTPGRTNSRWGGFLDGDVAGFDAHFFGIAPREAENMDPQQRLLLEVSWNALEDAAIAPDRLGGTATGVFVGISTADYLGLQLASGSPANAYTGTGTASSIAASRLSYVLDLRGPAWAVDTACSSSLVAVHAAVRSLRAGECNLALAGGVNLMLAPDTTIALSQARMLSSTGRCRAFDADADGYVRGEGCGVVVLKRLSEALDRGDRVLAVIRGSAVNQDGRSNGLTAPNGTAQRAVVRQALDDGGVEPGRVSYVEAHGSATPLGDPIELNALKEVLAEGRPPDAPFRVGSIKTNIGHLEAAAGIAGLIKVALSLHHGEIPRHLHFQTINPHIASAGATAVVPTSHEAWPSAGATRIGGVSSFGFGGTNAHVVLEEAPHRGQSGVGAGPDPGLTPAGDRPANLLVLSARTETSFRALAVGMDAHLEAHPDANLADVCHTAATGRAHFEHRAALVVGTSDRPGLTDLQPAIVAGEPQIAFLFTGQGSQYVGMGSELYGTQPVFRAALDRCAAILAPLLPRPLLEVMFDGPAAILEQTAYAQPALFALEYALAMLWSSWGIRASAMLGHSVGEYVAACLAGVFSLETGLDLIAARGRLMQELPSGGAMFAVRATEAAVRSAIAAIHAREGAAGQHDGNAVAIAAINGPDAVVLSGADAAVADLAGRWPAQRLRVSHAFHSPLMRAMLPEFERLARRHAFHPPRVRLIANVGGRVAGGEVADASYWVRHVTSPVQFAAGMRTLEALGITTFLEIGPSPVLVGMGARAIDGGTWLTSLRPGQGDWETILDALGRLYETGAQVDWEGVDRGYARRAVSLPTYPFERRRYWIDMSRRRDADPVGRLLYGVTWEPATTAMTSAATGSWLLLRDHAGVAEALAERLRAASQTCVIADDEIAPVGRILEDIGRVREDVGRVREDVGRVLLDPAARVGRVLLDPADAITGIVDLRPLAVGPAEAGPHEDQNPAENESAVVGAGFSRPGCGALLDLIHGVLAVNGIPPRLSIVTRRTAAHAPVQGLARVVALEHPEIWGTAVVLDAIPTSDDAARIAELLLNPDDEEAGVHEGVRVGRRLRPLTLPASDPFRVAPGDAMLITGGLGTIGLALARWLVGCGARQLVLLGRRAPDAGAQAAVAALRAHADRVLLLQADVTSREEMSAALARAAAEGLSIRGVFHAAGTATEVTLDRMGPADLDAVLPAKVQGAALLDELTRGLDLRYFVAFSSIASVWGARGLAHYAAANGFLDALVHERRARGDCGLSVNWGPWRDGGLLSDDLGASAERIGLRRLPTDVALAALGRLLQSGMAQAVVADVDWSIFKPAYELRGRRHLLAHVGLADRAADGVRLPVERGDAASQMHGSLRGGLRASLEAMPGADRFAALAAHVQREVAALLKLDRAELPDLKRGFFSMGMDSLMAVELRRRLEDALALTLPATLAFDSPNVRSLVDNLVQRLAWSREPAVASVAAPVTNGARVPVETLTEALTESEIAALIAGELERLEALVREP